MPLPGTGKLSHRLRAWIFFGMLGIKVLDGVLRKLTTMPTGKRLADARQRRVKLDACVCSRKDRRSGGFVTCSTNLPMQCLSHELEDQNVRCISTCACMESWAKRSGTAARPESRCCGRESTSFMHII